MSKSKQSKLKQNFLAKGYSPQNWCKAFGFTTGTLNDVFAGRFVTTLEKNGYKTKNQLVVELLKEQGVWQGPLPWEKTLI
jgi:hypothetical protein